MSTSVTAPSRAGLRAERATTPLAAARRRPSPDLILGIALAAALSLIAILSGGGTDLTTNTWVQVALITVAAGLLAAALIVGAPGRRWGTGTLLAFAMLVALTYGSIAWSVQPDASWLEANRVLSYLAAFSAAILLVRLFPGRWPALIGAVATAATVVSAYSLLLKVFPGSLDRLDQLGRLSQPLDYWNAIGLIAAMGIPACLWSGARQGAARWSKALVPPAIAILVSALFLSYSRGALIVAAVGVGLWFATVPLRLRGALILAIGGIGGIAVIAWALPNHAIIADYVPLAQRTHAGHTLGIVLLAVLAGCAAVGWLVSPPMERAVLPAPVRRRLGVALLAVVGLLCLGGVGALAASSRGLTGQVSHFWSTLTNPNGGTGDQPGRLVELSNSRPHYWSVGLKVGAHHLAVGAGELGFATAYTRYSHDRWPVGHAHSYVVETFADLGLVGVAVSLALLLAWGVAALRPLRTGPRTGPPRIRAPGETAERAGMLTLLAIVVVFGLHSLIDWTWFVPGTAVIALVCAGWLAGRGPLQVEIGLRAHRRRLSQHPAVGLVLLGLAAVATLTIWGTLQPLRSSQAYSASVIALTRGNAGAALTDARQAAARDPVSIDPRLLLSEIYAAGGQQAQARAQLVKATSLQPENPQTWSQLGDYDLAHHQPARAVTELTHAQRLYLGSAAIATQLRRAQAQASRPG